MQSKPDDYDPGVKVTTNRVKWDDELGEMSLVHLSVLEVTDRNRWVSNPHPMTAEMARDVAEELLEAADEVERENEE